MKASTSTILQRCAAAVLLLVGAASGMAQPLADKAAATAAREIRWEELMPKDWDPYKEIQARGSGRPVIDGTPQAMQLMRELRQIWDNAPVNQALDGQAVKLPGFVVPLEETKEGLKEFLLVPYFGACIHSPPPPANQIIHVVAGKPMKGLSTMDAVWVTGTLNLSRQESGMGVSGYTMAATAVARYVEPNR